jgi:Uma2 family endonuclease
MATQMIEQPTPTANGLIDWRHRITVAEFYRMLDADVFGHEPRIELLEGVIIDKTKKTSSHNVATDLLSQIFHEMLPRRCGFFSSRCTTLRIQDRNSALDPDLTILRGAPDDYAARFRTPADAPLVIEAADLTYTLDRFHKWTTYAASGVQNYWIVDLNNNRLEVHTQPKWLGDSASYARSVVYDQLDQDVPLLFDDREVAKFPLRDILP